MNAVVKSKSWWVVLACLMAGTALLIAGCSSDDSLTAPASSTAAGDLDTSADKLVPPEPGTLAVHAPPTAGWHLQGFKKARNVSIDGVGIYEDTAAIAGDYEVTFFPYVDGGVWAPDDVTQFGTLRKQDLTFATSYSLMETLILEQDLELLDPENTSALNEVGWLNWTNELSNKGDIIGSYASVVYNNCGESWCFQDIVTEQGGPDQGLQQLVFYSDYNNPNQALYTIENNLYQEWTLGTDIPAGIVVFTFDAKMGDLQDSPIGTAAGFIKVIDPNNGYALVSMTTVDLTDTPVEWTGYMLSIDSTNLTEGMLLQFGFMNTTKDYAPTGIYYDNVRILN